MASCPARMHTPRRDQHALLTAALVACALASSAGAQPAAPQGFTYGDVSGQQVHVSTTMIVLLAAVVAVFLFIAFSTIYLRHCTGYPEREGDAGRFMPANSFISRRQRRPSGLDSSVIRMFPTMKYAEAKALRVGKVAGALECAVCLSEFEDDEMLRFLPKCSHAFHPDCIGQWLASHVTCPVCRRNLDPNKDTTEEVIIPAGAGRETNSTSSEIAVVRQDDGAHPAAVVIDVVTEEDEEERRKEEMELEAIGTQLCAMRSRSGLRPVTAPKLVRSHSTDHSLAVRLDRDLERFTLRLPEHVHREMVAAGEQSVRCGRRVGEGSSRGGHCSPRLARSGRWPSFLPSPRSLSGKLPFFSASRRTPDSTELGEVSSSSSSSTKVKGKRVAAVDAVDSSAQGTAAGSAAASAAVDVEKAATRRRMNI